MAGPELRQGLAATRPRKGPTGLSASGLDAAQRPPLAHQAAQAIAAVSVLNLPSDRHIGSNPSPARKALSRSSKPEAGPTAPAPQPGPDGASPPRRPWGSA